MPRDVDPRCGELEGVTLYDIDDLQQVVARNLDTRAGEVPRAEQIVEEEIRRFAGWLGQLEALPTVSALREHGDAIVAQVLAENDGRWESASPRDLVRVEALARSIANRILHEPTIRLRSLSETRSHASLQLVRELFALQQDGEEEASGETPPRAAPAGRTPNSPRCTTCSGAGARARRSFGGVVRIGTRGSALALAQARLVAALLEPIDGLPGRRGHLRRAGYDHNRRGSGSAAEHADSGNPPTDERPLAGGDKSRWVLGLERALSAGEIDLAVHSAKDVPGDLADGLSLMGAPRGQRPRTCCAW